MPGWPRDRDRDKELRKQVRARHKGLIAKRRPWDKAWHEVSRFSMPRLSGFIRAYGGAPDNASGETLASIKIAEDILNTKLYDGHGVWAAEVLGNGMSSGLSSPSRPWFTVTTEDPDLKEFSSVKVWLDEVQRRLYAFFAKTNFYQAVKGGYLENGIFGVEAAVMTAGRNVAGVTHHLPAGSYWIAQNDDLQVDTLYRRSDMTARQIITRFYSDNTQAAPRRVREAWDQAKYEMEFAVYHAIEPNHDRKKGRLDAENRRFRSIYWMEGCDEKLDPPLLSSSGFGDRPFWASRWDVIGPNSYGDSPAMRAYADIRQLQYQSLRKQQGIDWMLTPALQGPITLNHQNANLAPRSITPLANLDQQKMEAIWEVKPQAIGVLAEDIGATKQAIDRGLYVDLLLAITNMPGIQPRNMEEIARRNEEKLQQLGPVVDRTNVEKLTAAIDRAFIILLRAGQIPPPPEELQGRELRIEFVSVMAQMQRILGLGAIERGVSFVGNIVAQFPEAGDKLDVDQAIDEYFDIAGTPAKIVRSDEAVAQMRRQRAEAQAAQEQAAQLAAAAPAAAQGANAARLLSETDDGQGSNLLARLMGQA